MRAFVAVDLSRELKTAMEALIRQVRAGARGTKWVPPQGMHLTLKFLGWISDSSAASIEAELANVLANRVPFRLRLKGTGTFPPGWKNTARVLWVGIEEDAGLMGLQKDLDAALEKLGFACEERPFHPHLTIGRVKTPEGLVRVLDNLVKFRETEFGEMPVTGVTFFQSVLTPSGADYKPLAEVPFT
jgi:RNA 2',3'-cyclic 3'-phosphodiesterase